MTHEAATTTVRRALRHAAYSGPLTIARVRAFVPKLGGISDAFILGVARVHGWHIID